MEAFRDTPRPLVSPLYKDFRFRFCVCVCVILFLLPSTPLAPRYNLQGKTVLKWLSNPWSQFNIQLYCSVYALKSSDISRLFCSLPPEPILLPGTTPLPMPFSLLRMFSSHDLFNLTHISKTNQVSPNPLSLLQSPHIILLLPSVNL